MSNNENERDDLVGLARTLKKHNIANKDTISFVNRFLELKARNQRIPLVGLFELTPYCNLDCKMCYVHVDKGQDRSVLSTDKWKDLMLQAYEAGMRSLKFSGGECLTHPGFNELYLLMHSKRVRLSIATNGVLLDRNRIDLLKEYPPHSIQVSLYGASDDAYESVTGHRCFNTVYENIMRLKIEGLPVTIAITPNIYIMHDIEALFRLVESLNIPYRVNSLLIPPRSNTGRKFEGLSTNQYVEVFEKINRIKKIDLIQIDPMELPSVGSKGVLKQGLLCGAGRSSFAILNDGSMCPCVSLDEYKTNPLEIGFTNAWKEVVRIADSYMIPEECGDCVYRTECLNCAAAHKEAPVQGHCDPRVCERTKGYVSAGILKLPTNKK